MTEVRPPCIPSPNRFIRVGKLVVTVFRFTIHKLVYHAPDGFEANLRTRN